MSTLRVRHMPLQDLAAFVFRQRRFDGGPAQESVARIHDLGARLLEPFQRRRARRRFTDALGRDDAVVERFGERAAHDRARRIDLHRIAALERGQAGGFERLERERQRERMPLGDEGGKAASES